MIHAIGGEIQWQEGSSLASLRSPPMVRKYSARTLKSLKVLFLRKQLAYYQDHQIRPRHRTVLLSLGLLEAKNGKFWLAQLLCKVHS